MNKALVLDPTNEKARLRQLLSLEQLERFDSAFEQAERLLQDAETREKHPTLFNYAVVARRRLKKAVEQDKKAAEKEIGTLGRLVHENQQLRINFGCVGGICWICWMVLTVDAGV